MAYQIDGDVEQNRMQVKFSSYGQTGALGVRSKGQISLNFTTKSILSFLFQTLCAFLQIKDRKHIERNFQPVAGFMPRVGTWGAGWVKNLSVGICDGTPSTVHSSLSFSFSIFFLIFFFFATFSFIFSRDVSS